MKINKARLTEDQIESFKQQIVQNVHILRVHIKESRDETSNKTWMKVIEAEKKTYEDLGGNVADLGGERSV